MAKRGTKAATRAAPQAGDHRLGDEHAALQGPVRHLLDELAPLEHRVRRDTFDHGRCHTKCARAAECLMRRRPIQFTKAVKTIKITARAPRAATCSGVASWNCEGDGGGEGGGRREQRVGKEGVQADDHGDGHGLAEGTRRREGHRAHDARAGGGEHDLSQHLPFRRPDTERPFELVMGNDGDGISRQRHDHGQDHDEQHAAGQQQRHTLKGRLEGEVVVRQVGQARLHGLLEPGGEHEQAPQPVDDARHGGEQLDERGGEYPQPAGKHVHDGEGGADADRDGEDEGDRCRHERARDDRERSE